MTATEADQIVLEQLVAQAAGIRMRAKSPVVGTRAGLLESELSQRLAEVERELASQGELFRARRQHDHAA